MTPLVSYEEIDRVKPPELRFRQACQFYALFKENHGAGVDPLDTCFLWMCYADAFLMSLVSLKDVVNGDQREPLKNGELFCMMTVLRNVTVHQAVVSKSSPFIMTNRNITLHAGSAQPRQEDVVLNTNRITEALDHYDSEIKKIPRLKRGISHDPWCAAVE
jgi:hypothetical protein